MDEWIESLVSEGWVLRFESTLDDHLNSITMVTASRGEVSIKKIGWNTIKLVNRLMDDCSDYTPRLLNEY